MPKAVTTLDETQRFELKSCPGAFVVLRRMTFGESVQRRAMLKLSVETSRGSKDLRGEMAMANEEITRFEFQRCVVDHNLEDGDSNKLNLGAPVDFARLDPRVGQEIEKLIGDMNNFNEEDDPELGN